MWSMKPDRAPKTEVVVDPTVIVGVAAFLVAEVAGPGGEEEDSADIKLTGHYPCLEIAPVFTQLRKPLPAHP